MRETTTKERRQARAIVLGISMVVGFFAFLYAGFTTYFMNDIPTGADNLRFASLVVSGSLLAAVIASITIRYRQGWGWARSAACSFGGAFGVNGFGLGLYFATGASDLGADPTYFYDVWTVGQVYAFAAACAVVWVACGSIFSLALRHTAPVGSGDGHGTDGSGQLETWP